MKLWTIQSKEVVAPREGDALYVASWEHVKNGEDWDRAFRMMADQYEQRTGIKLNGALIWAWHSYEKFRAPPTVQCAIDLHGTAEELFESYDLFTLDVPKERITLSSYALWNKHICNDVFLDDPIERDGFLESLDDPRLENEHDALQAVFDCITPEMVLERRAIDVRGRNLDELL